MEGLTKLLELSGETLQLLQSGGTIILPIAALSIGMWFLILRQLVELRAAKRERAHLEHCGLLCAKAVPDPSRGWLARLLAEFHEQRSYEQKADRQLLQALLEKQAAAIERYVPTILVLAAAAPLLGLLGTVTGMIATFDAISQLGTGNPRALATGISEALITTQCGLAVAIPGLIMGTYLDRRAQRFRIRLEGLGLRLHRLYQTDPTPSSELPGENS